MIVTATPYRITLGGGGTDLPSFYEQHGGFVVAMAIDKRIRIALHRPVFDDVVRVHHARSEWADHPSTLRHDLAREALLAHDFDRRIAVHSFADLPGGAGLGSSSAYLVGCLLALRALRGAPVEPEILADEACRIELERLGRKIGKQDQYMAAFGGIRVLDIDRAGAVSVRDAAVAADTRERLETCLRMYWTGVRRRSGEVLAVQNDAMRESGGPDRARVEDALVAIRQLGEESLRALEAGDPDAFGRLMDTHWEHKQRLSDKITVRGVDTLYADLKARLGVLGGKVSGAGGGGFFCVYAPDRHAEVDHAMAQAGMTRMPYRIGDLGAHVLVQEG